MNYKCPDCEWMAGDEYDDIFLEECYYKFDEDKLKVISRDDLTECKQDPPPDYYPRFGITYPYNAPDGSGWDWNETWLCPHCKKEFSFINGT